MSQNRFSLLLSIIWCSEPVSSSFLQNIPHSLSEVKATQGSDMHVVTAAGLRNTFHCMSAVASSQNIFSVFCYLLKTPAPPANWPLLFVFWRSQLLFINDEPWCWHKVGRAGGFLFLSVALSIMQHSGRCSLGEAEEMGTHRQDPSCALCWQETLTGCLHWSVLFLQSLGRTSGIKTPAEKYLLKTGDNRQAEPPCWLPKD